MLVLPFVWPLTDDIVRRLEIMPTGLPREMTDSFIAFVVFLVAILFFFGEWQITTPELRSTTAFRRMRGGCFTRLSWPLFLVIAVAASGLRIWAYTALSETALASAYAATAAATCVFLAGRMALVVYLEALAVRTAALRLIRFGRRLRVASILALVVLALLLAVFLAVASSGTYPAYMSESQRAAAEFRLGLAWGQLMAYISVPLGGVLFIAALVFVSQLRVALRVQARLARQTWERERPGMNAEVIASSRL